MTFSPFLLFSFLLGGLARNDGRPRLAMTALLPLIFGREAVWLCHSLSEALTACTAWALLLAQQRRSTPAP